MTTSDDLLVTGPARASRTVVLAHGAGAPMDSPFMVAMAQGLAEHGIRTFRFEFPYMRIRRETGKKRPPDREPLLRQAWHDVLGRISARRPIIGGKSLGGRIASLVADEVAARGLICLGYPFHPPGKPDQPRTEHLRKLKTSTLILQGQRDPFGNEREVPDYDLSEAIRVEWLPDGDHGFKPRKASGRTEDENWQAAVHAMVRFIRSRN